MNKIKAKLSGKKEIARSLTRLAHEIIEKNDDLSQIAIVGIRTRGDFLSKRLHTQIEKLSDIKIPIGTLDVTFHREYHFFQLFRGQYGLDCVQLPFCRIMWL